MPMMERVQFEVGFCTNFRAPVVSTHARSACNSWIQKEDANPRVAVFGGIVGGCLHLYKQKLFRVISGDSGTEIFEEAWKI